MKRILLRGRKGPFDVVSPERTLEKNSIGTNSGNLVFIHAAYKLLWVDDVEISMHRGRPDPKQAERINREFDAYVVPLANAFRPSFQPYLLALSALIEELTIPVTILGVGAQADLGYDATAMKAFERTVKRFVNAVLDHGASIGVRGEFTAEYLRGLGYSDVEVIGCPSMFFNGGSFVVTRKRATLDDDSPLAINTSPGVAAMDPILLDHERRFAKLVYVPQDIDTLALMLWGRAPLASTHQPGLPIDPKHPLFAHNKVRFFVDPSTWIDYLGGVDFVYGTRIHGNITGLIAGTPAYVIAHDSRTLELARYFEIPHCRATDIKAGFDPLQAYLEADYGPLQANHPQRFDTFTAFMRRHGLRNVFEAGEDSARFGERLKTIDFPPPVEMVASPVAVGIRRRVRYAAKQLQRGDRVRALRAALSRGKKAPN